jgi:SOS response regulatory protein OraA/RecX
MALVKCPECGSENVSSTAKSCPGCGYNIKAYYEEEQQKEVASNSAAPTNKINVKAIIGVAVACIVIFCIYYFSTRCAFDGCTEKRTENSKYCAYHSLSKSYSSSSNDYTPKTGNAGAEARAKSYLNSSAFSYTGLIHQLEYEGFSTSEATYGADKCGADWKNQALRKAKSYLNSSAFSYSGLQDQLEYEGFTEDEAQYGANNCNADWDNQAYKKAKSYLQSSPNMEKADLIHQLQYEGFSYEQAVYGVNQAGL